MPNATGIDLPHAEESLGRVREELLAIPPEQIRPPTFNVPRGVVNAVQCARSFQRDRARFAIEYRPEALERMRLDDLAVRAEALFYCDARYRMVADPQGVVADYLERAREIRHELLRTAEFLWEEDPRLGPRVADIRGGRGKLDTVEDLVSLNELYGPNWDAVAPRCAFGEELLAEARTLAMQLVDLLGSGPATPEDETRRTLQDLRDRAATHLADAMLALRTAARFVFRDDPERIGDYPSLYTRPNRPRPATPSEPEPEPEPS